MDEYRAFLEAIRANIKDDTPRLIYADWLEENGEEARAEFIRVQVELAKPHECPQQNRGLCHFCRGLIVSDEPKEYGPRFKACAKRSKFVRHEDDLFRQHFHTFREHREAWSLKLGCRVHWNLMCHDISRNDGMTFVFRRGFVALVQLSVRQWQQYGALLRVAFPVENWHIEGFRIEAGEL